MGITLVRIAVTARDLVATTPLLRAGGFSVRTGPGGVVAERGGVVAERGGTTIRFDEVPWGRPA